ncbi:hypothetical protein Ahy_A01g002878 [Arachis hypogaea]|uniref:Uncharacterized protein n=1 Tax=Arachis hypogaea TaxID=3818 RepID=A0A445ERN3_ARAHY|nr:hypothetical protein Ahy_A01g002878 [Arachis hypogaea]
MADEMSNVNGSSSTNDSIPVSLQQADVNSCSEGAIGTEMGSFVPPICFGNASGVNNTQNPQHHSEYSRDYNVGFMSNAANLMAAYRHQVEESHHDLVNLLTQQMTTILNPMMADHESKFEHFARQVERIARIADYDEGKGHNVKGNNEGIENVFQNKNNVLNQENSYVVPRGQNADDVLARLRANHGGERFYMRRKLLNVHISDLAHLAEKVRHTELMKKEKEKYRSEQRSKIAYVTMESSEEEIDFETEVDLAKLKKALLMFLPSNEKSNDSKLKSGKKYSFDISKSDQIFDVFRSQAIGVQWIINCQEFQRREHLYRRNPQWRHRAPSQNQYPYYRGRATGYSRGRGGRKSFNQNRKPQSETGKEIRKGATSSRHFQMVFPSDGETYPKEIPSPAKMDKGKVMAQSSRVDKNKEVDVDEEYFDEGDDDMIGMISIILTEYLAEYEGDPEEDYDMED